MTLCLHVLWLDCSGFNITCWHKLENGSLGILFLFVLWLISINIWKVGPSSENSYLNITWDVVQSMLYGNYSFAPAFSFIFSLSFMPLIPLLSSYCLSQVKGYDLERRCRSQNEHYYQLSKELLNFHLQSDTVDILKINPTSSSHVPLSPEKKPSQVIVGFEAQTDTGGPGLSTYG